MRKINTIIIHCSATRPSQDIGKVEIESWHKKLGWLGIGYHYIIRRDGSVEIGRDIAVTGAHTKGHNVGSVGICMVGGVTEKDVNIAEDNFNLEQYEALENLIRELKQNYPTIRTIKGHGDYANKACPSFDVADFVAEKLKDV